MLPSGADLAAGTLGAGGDALASLLPQLMGAVGTQASQTSTALVKHLGSLSNAVGDASRAGVASFETLKSSLSQFGSGLASTLEGMWNVGSGPGAAGNSANGLAILGGASSLLTQAGGGALSLMQGVGNKASSVLSSGANMVGSIGSAAGNMAGMLAGAINPLLGPLVGGLTSALFAPLKAAFSVFSSAISGITSVLGTLGETALKALGAFSSAVMAATEAALKMAREVASIRNNTGRSLQDSQQGYWNLRGAGFSGEAASGFLGGSGTSFVSSMRTRAWGLPDVTDSHFAEKFAALFQKLEASGPTGYLKAKAMADSVAGGKASPELLQLAHTNPATLQREQKWTQGVQKSLGVSPEAMRRFSDEFPLLINRISTFVESVKVRFATDLLPMLQAVLNGLTEFLASHADQIASIMQSAVQWLYVEGPTWILKGASMGLTALESLVNGFFSMAEGISGFLRAIGEGQSGLYSVFQLIATIIDAYSGTDISAELLNFKNSNNPQNWADSIDKFVKSGREKTGSMFGTAHKAMDNLKAFDNKEERASTLKSEFQKLHEGTKEISKATKESGQKVVEALHKTSAKDSQKALLSRVGHYVATDQYLSSTR